MGSFRDYFLKRDDRTYPVTSVPGANYHSGVAVSPSRPAISSGVEEPIPARAPRKEVTWFIQPDYNNVEETLLRGKIRTRVMVRTTGGGMLEWDERFNIYRPVPDTYGNRFELRG